MFSLQNFNLLNSVPQISVLAKYGMLHSSSFSVIKKIPELDGVCNEIIQALQLLKDTKYDKLWDYFSNIRLDPGLKDSELFYVQDVGNKFRIDKTRNCNSDSKCEESLSTVSSLGEYNKLIEKVNGKKYEDLNYRNILCSGLEACEEFKSSNYRFISKENKIPLSVISQIVTCRKTSNQSIFKNSLYSNHARVFQLIGCDMRIFCDQRRGFKTQRQSELELERSFIGILRKLAKFNVKKTEIKKMEDFTSEVSKKEVTPTPVVISENKTGQTYLGGHGSTSSLIKFLGNLLSVLFWTLAIVVGAELYYSTDKFVTAHIPERVNVTFDDVKGMDEAKGELQCVVEYLRDPSKFMYLGGKLPSGILLQGPPGTGKTLLARAVAGEADVQFFHVSGSEFDEILVGQGARRVRELFQAARKRAPAVIFIDEIDAVGGKRVSSALNPFANQTVNQLLSEMDGFIQNEKIVVIGATNRESDLDDALLRPGRFDLKIYVNMPDVKGRREILSLYLNKIIWKDIDIDYFAKRTAGFSGADLENLVNQAALIAATNACEYVTTQHLEQAFDKILLGPELKSKVRTELMNKITAYHESGHATVAYFTPGSSPPIKATIIPRGKALGYTSCLPEEGINYSKSELLALIDKSMGGRAAEELIFGPDKVTVGCENDLESATNIATNMVRIWGMSDKVGLRTHRTKDHGKIEVNDWGQATTDEIDLEIKRIIQESYERAKRILKKHAKEHKLLAESLLEKETLDANEIKEILGPRKDDDGSVKDEISK